MGHIKYPEAHDLRKLVRFSADDGLIWLAENRMLLMHVAGMGSLRKELINNIGPEQARRILTRIGYVAGLRDAELVRKVRPSQSLVDAFCAGPQLHMLEGSVRVIPVALRMDLLGGDFYGEFLWERSWEAETHLQEFGPADHPVCWMQIGYASGYSSGFAGRFILFKETECAACGTNNCRIVGKPVEQWEDADEHLPYYKADSMVNRMLDLRHQVDELRSTLVDATAPPSLVGASPGFKRAYDLMQRAAGTQVSVLLLGETGVGKERFARCLHQLSQRKDKPFVAVNCAAMPHDLIESELFGVEKGAFTGAHASRMGKFERADGGTLFLDEIGELPAAAQAKLLRVLQEGEIERLGDERTRKVNVRLVAATNVNLAQAAKEGRFRNDLYYRLNVYPIEIPPLRERNCDVPTLVDAMLAKFSALHEKRVAGVTDKAMQALKSYAWPGNIRELENLIERGIILAPAEGWIEAEHLFMAVQGVAEHGNPIGPTGKLEEVQAPGISGMCDTLFQSGMSLDQIEDMLLQEAVKRAGGNLAAAARQLGLTRPQLSYRLKKGGSEGADAMPH